MRDLRGTIKKILRSGQVLFPGAIKAKFDLLSTWYELSGKLWKPDFEGARHFDFAGKTILDLGANRGQCIATFKKVAPHSQIVSFEANRYLAEQLRQKYAGDALVRIEICALSNANNTLQLFVPFYNGYMFDGLSSVHRSEAEDWLDADRLYFFDRAKVQIQETVVEAKKLDEFNLKPALIKAHIQRSEIDAFKGAQNTLRVSRPILLCAYVWDQLSLYLTSLGYRRYRYFNGKFLQDQIGREFTWFFLPEHIQACSTECS